jgi:hypothetical protein
MRQPLDYYSDYSYSESILLVISNAMGRFLSMLGILSKWKDLVVLICLWEETLSSSLMLIDWMKFVNHLTWVPLVRWVILDIRD